ncbi:hypothetical protein PGTUg99_023730 [Puccinia graminis f. sp. tritici]|uniref:Prolyl 4-hydroxylase alpha subunit domain-containing protein n=1 Tax=Puccinia graminis f. sp. tritici TaxID=56615 RepID=A0A5B0QLN2_PUCGR|nr:hypothetical protein PGTUg99_023730 [Puccinia graminis f. sp. tritici]
MMPTAQSKNTKKNKSGGKTSSNGAATGKQATETAVGWPMLKPKPKLKAETIIPSQIMTMRELLTEEECKRVIRALDHLRTADGDILRFETTSRTPKRGEAFRYNDRISIHDPLFADTLWAKTGLKTSCEAWLREQGSHRDDDPQAARCWGLNPNLRFYRYRVGHKFEKHFDESVQISKSDLSSSSSSSSSSAIQSEMPETLWTEYTLLIYLTGSKDPIQKSTKEEAESQTRADGEPLLRGGETVFYNTPIRSQKRLTQEHSVAASVSPVAGLALIHRHGSECLLHEAREVIAGAKYVLRSDLVFG